MKANLPPPPPENPDILSHPMRDELLRRGGGGPYDTGMEERIAKLEKKMERVEDKLGILSERISELSGKVSMLPGYPGIAVVMTVVGGALLIVSRLFPAAIP